MTMRWARAWRVAMGMHSTGRLVGADCASRLRLQGRAMSSSSSSVETMDATGVTMVVVRHAQGGPAVRVVHETPERLVGREVVECVGAHASRQDASTILLSPGDGDHGRGGTATVRWAGPDRGVGVDIETGGGAVEVGKVRYMPLRCVTGGGALSAGSVNASSVEIQTMGGDVSAPTLSGSPMRVDTGGGGLRVSKLVAPEGVIRIGRGRMDIGSLFFGSCLTVDGEGGAVRIQTCEPSVPGSEGGLAIGTRGGPVHVQDALSGRVSVATGGGPIDVKLDKPQGAALDARGSPDGGGTSGPVSLHLTSGQRYALTVTPPFMEGGPLVAASGSVREVRREEREDGGLTVWLEAGQPLAEESGSAVLRDNRPPEDRMAGGGRRQQWHAVTVHGPGDGLTVDVRSWMPTFTKRPSTIA